MLLVLRKKRNKIRILLNLRFFYRGTFAVIIFYSTNDILCNCFIERVDFRSPIFYINAVVKKLTKTEQIK